VGRGDWEEGGTVMSDFLNKSLIDLQQKMGVVMVLIEIDVLHLTINIIKSQILVHESGRHELKRRSHKRLSLLL